MSEDELFPVCNVVFLVLPMINGVRVWEVSVKRFGVFYRFCYNHIVAVLRTPALDNIRVYIANLGSQCWYISVSTISRFPMNTPPPCCQLTDPDHVVSNLLQSPQKN